MKPGLLVCAAAVVVLAMPAGAPAAQGGGNRIASVARVVAHRPLSVAARPALPVLPRSAAALRRAKRAAERRTRRVHPQPLPRAATRAAVVPGLLAPGLRASQSLFGVPPDTTGAIGPAHYVEIVNDAIAVFRRADLVRVRGPVLNETFTRAPAGTFVSDPQMQWDPQSGRWFYLAVAFTVNPATLQPSGPNYLVYGFSKSDDPSDLNQGWCRYSVASGSTTDGRPLLDDFPKLGHDDQHLIFGSNVFALGGGADETFITARIWSVPKPPAGALSVCPPAATATAFGDQSSPLRTSTGELVTTPIPANTTDSSAAGYVVAARDATLGRQSQIVAWQVAGTADVPALVPDGEITVGGYRVPRPARQFVFPRIDTLDARLTMAVAHADPDAGGQEAVWTQHTVDPGDGSVAMRWYELLPGQGTARQQGTVSELGVDVFNGAVSPATDGRSAVAVYNRSGLLLLPQIRARSRTGSMAAGVLGPSIGIASSSSPDYDLGCAPVCRWGDYSGASPDPAASSVVWVASQAIANPGGLLPNWTTTIAAVDAAGA